MALGLWLRGGPPPAVTPTPFGSVIFVVMGGILAALGCGVYGTVLGTCCFTFNFHKPFVRRLSRKLWVSNLVVGWLLQFGFALMMAPTMIAVLWRVVPAQFLTAVALLAPFIVANFVLIWVQIWAPLERTMIVRRLLA